MAELPNPGRIEALDGLRGIAILMVIFDHGQGPWHGQYFYPWTQTGSHGVTLFFVLSGYLITANLLRESDLKSFYVRRFFRLMPVAWSYLAFLSLMGLLFPAQALQRRDLLSCIFFFRNYIPVESHFLPTAHFWSLSLEEQFYLTWPALLILIKPKRAIWFLGLSATVIALFRFTHFASYNSTWPSFHSEVRADAICIGCVLAITLQRQSIRESIGRVIHWVYLPATATIFACIGMTHNLPPLIEACAFAVLIAGAILDPKSPISQLLAIAPLAWLGTISYSAYVWQGFFLRDYGFQANIVMTCLGIAAILASYFLIEKPLTSFGRRISRSLVDAATDSTSVAGRRGINSEAAAYADGSD